MTNTRRIDYFDLVNKDVNWAFLLGNPDATLDEAYQCFWVKANSPTDTWLKLYGIQPLFVDFDKYNIYTKHMFNKQGF